MTVSKGVRVSLNMDMNFAKVDFGPRPGLGVSVIVRPFNPPGEQTESELRQMAISQARIRLMEAYEATA